MWRSYSGAYKNCEVRHGYYCRVPKTMKFAQDWTPILFKPILFMSKAVTITAPLSNYVYGGAGEDVFIYANGDGKDTITDYTAGQDKIRITSGTISSYSFSVKNVIFKIDTDPITVKDGKGKKITITDSNNKTTTQIYSNLASSADIFEDDNFIS